MSVHEKVVLIGAGSVSFTRGLVSDMLRRRWAGEIALVDIDPHALEVAEGLVRKMVALAGADVSVAAAVDRADVLPDATVVITTIGVGGRRAWEQDVFVPRSHGIYQPVGDSVMPGGTSRALRMIPPMIAIARDVQVLAPKALFFNYGNPMAAVCRAVWRETGAPMVGLCHGVHDWARFLARTVDVERDDLAYSAVGINHMTWFTEVYRLLPPAPGAPGERVREDVVPRLKAYGRERGVPHTELGARFAEAGTADWADAIHNPFCFQLLELFDAIPAPGDRHVCEFFPPQFKHEHAYFGKTLGVDAFSFEQTIANGDRGFAEMEQLALSNRPLPDEYLGRAGGEHEQVVDIIESIRTGARKVYSANLPNRGQVANLPLDAPVEAPAVAGANGLQAVIQAPLSRGIAGTLATRMEWVETVVDAAVACDRRKFVQALVLDGALDSLAQGEKLADELLAAQAAHLAGWT
jgi:alpha-galactosidase